MNRIGTMMLFWALTLSLTGCRTGHTLQITSAWARPGFKGESTAVYFRISNSSVQPDLLIQARASVAENAEIHQSSMDLSGMMHMEAHESIPVPANSSVELVPGGYHIMLTGLTQDLETGDNFSLILTFKNAGEISVPVEVKQP